MGGAIFVVEGGILNLQGNLSIDGNTVAAGDGGTGGTGGTAGSAFGSGLFLQGSGTLTFDPGAMQTQIIGNVIADQSGSIPGSPNFAAGGPTCTNGVGCAGYSGDGSWVLNKTGAGTLALGAANTYSGGTNLLAGTLSLGNSNALGSGDLNASPDTVIDYLSGISVANTVILNGGNVQFNVAAGTATQTGAIQETVPSSVEKTGSGTLVFGTGFASAYSGTTTINAGTLQVDGSIASSSLTSIISGGTLTGTGAIGNTQVNAGGVLAPGNGSPGSQMSILGDLTFAAGGIYRVVVDPTQASSAAVFGTANLGGATVNAQFAPGTYLTNQYLIMQAVAVNGAFNPAVATTNMPVGFDASLSYLGSDVYLDLIAQLGGTGGASLPRHSQNVASTLNNYFNSGGTLPPAFVALFGMTGDTLQTALNQISGESGASVSTSTFMAWNSFFNMIFDPYAQNRGGFGGDGAMASTAAAPSDKVRLADAAVTPNGDLKGGLVTKAPALADPFASRWRVWGGGYGGSATTDGNAQTGSHDTTSRAYGFAAGADHRLAPDTLIGFALAGGGTSFGVDQGLGGGTSDMFQASVYARQGWGAAYLMGAFGYGWQDFTLNRTVTIAGTDKLEADFNANTLAGRAEGGWRFGGPMLGLTPYAALQIASIDLPAFTERATSGANTFALSYAGRTDTQTRSEFGARFDYAMPMQDALLILRGRAAWAHDYDNDRIANAGFLTLPGTAFTVTGAQPDADSLLVSAGAELAFLNGFSLAGSFEGGFSGNTESYAGKGAIRYRW